MTSIADFAGPRNNLMLTQEDVVDAPSIVCVFERDERVESLMAVVRQMNYTAIRGESIEAARLSSRDSGILAALVSDGIERPLALCASIPAWIPKIMLASDHSFGFRLAAARSDVTAVLQRPLQASELADWLKLFSVERSVVTASIVIVDDDPVLAALHAGILRSAGMRVCVVSDPNDALGVIEATRPDLVLMDVQMPEIDGIELARIIRQSRQHVTVPIVFLSVEQDVGRQIEASRYGGDIFINKPVDPRFLISLVRMRADRARTLRSMIERDSLTGLYNHGQFKERLILEFERSRRTGSHLSFAMIDIDHFKKVNDSYGHPVGDRVIRGLASLLATRLRRTDVVGRYGGEEFGVLLLDTPADAAITVIDNVRQMLCSAPFDASGESFTVTFSAGIAAAAASDGPEDFIADADRALYVAKLGGRNRVELAVTGPGIGLAAGAPGIVAQPAELVRRLAAAGWVTPTAPGAIAQR
jgi:diguanylate cyclase (GGDEF)-like protein